MTGSHTPFDYVFVVGIRSNFLGLLPDAIHEANERKLTTRIVDVHPILPDVSKYPNDWRSVGLESEVTTVTDSRAMDEFLTRHVSASTIVVFLYPPDRHLRPIWRRFASRGARVGAMLISPMPTSSWTTGESCRPAWQRIGLYLKSWLKPRPDFIVVSGTVCRRLYETYFRSLKDVHTIKAHSIEYELCRRARTDDRISGRVAAFLDQGWFSKPKPPFVDASQYPPLTLETYRELTRSLFDLLEGQFGLEVIVCAHPKGDRRATEALFEGREVAFGETLSIVRDSSLVIAHNSTSLVYAIIFGKPLVLFDCEQLRNSIFRESFAALRRELPLPVVDLDHPRITTVDLSPDQTHYERFLTRYIKQDPGNSGSVWQILYEQSTVAPA